MSGLGWIVVGLVLLGAELLLPGAFLIWVGLASFGAGLVALTGLGLKFQVVTLLLVLGGSVWAVLRQRRRGAANVNAAGSGLVGRAAIVTSVTGSEGRVRVGDSEWAAVPVNGALPLPGTRLRVVAVRGITLVVEPESDEVP